LFVSGITGVLFDWRGTLVADPEDQWWVRRAFARLGRQASPNEVGKVVEGLALAGELDDVRQAWLTADCSADLHRAASYRYFAAAGLDADLSDALYELDLDPDSHPFGLEVAEVLQALNERGTKTAVVSDIHFDVRPEFAAAGLDGLIDAFVLSFEHGVQKPDPALFRIALDILGVRPEETLMVGDRASRDGGATQVGITTLLVPTLRQVAGGRLRVILPLIQPVDLR
jgi:HAD superfamily hydrolase (TIGR01509 family)